ncbi:MAG: hypothetical protein DRP65_10590 [Planctomycetota bacterium]|nr:MAG: hypothetical protein DRP65_10590 [Planctomycetota bacterium]
MTIRIRRWHLAAVLVAAVVLLSITPAMQAAKAEEDIWSDKPTGMRQRPRLSEVKFEEFLDRLAKTDPERAKELRKLRKDNPEQFRKEVQEAFAERRRMGDRLGDEPRGQGRGSGRSGPATGPGRMQAGTGPDQQRGPGVGRSDRRERWRKHIETRHDEYIKWLKKNFPAEAKKLAKLREKDQENPEAYFKQVMESRAKFGEIMEAEERNPELAKILKEEIVLKKDRDKLLARIQTAKGKQRQDLIRKLEEAVNTRFDLIVRKKQLRYEYLLRRLERLQKEVKQREAEVEKLKNKKARLIKERLEELTSNAEKINWD